MTPYRSALNPSSSVQQQFLEESLQWLKTWKIKNKEGKDVTSHFKFVEGWILNIQAVRLLAADLCEEGGFLYLCTRRLSSDPLENFFSIIRGKGGFEQNPSCLGFARAFRNCVTN